MLNLSNYGLKLNDFETRKVHLLSSFMIFLQTFFFLKTGHQFVLSNPAGRESHFITIGKQLNRVFNLESNRLIINVPPGYSKSTMVSYFVAWALARYPDCNFLYISYSHETATKNTALIRDIISLPEYQMYFGVSIDKNQSARDNFSVVSDRGNGCVRGYGSGGGVTGQNAGFPHCDRFSGCLIIDDPIKPDCARSDAIREGVILNYNETIKQRVRGTKVPMVFIGQRVRTDDLAQYLLDGNDGHEWEQVVLDALDGAGNPLYPEFHCTLTDEELSLITDPTQRGIAIAASAKKWLLNEQKHNPYVFSSQYQQRPVPDGGGIFKSEDFLIMDNEPEILKTFLCVDTAETEKSWNDATVFSFFGLYKIKFGTSDTGLWGIHWIDCEEIRVEPADLESYFFSFYMRCLKHKIKPDCAIIEKKSTGTTLISILKKTPGIRILEMNRARTNDRPYSKVDRFIEASPFVSRHQISLTRGDFHVEPCIKHMSQITSNGTHAHDDIADTLQMAIQTCLVEGIMLPQGDNNDDLISKQLAAHQAKRINRSYGIGY